MDDTESPPVNPKKRSPWKKESNKHKPQIPSKQRNRKYPQSLKIRLKSLETIEISEFSQIKNQNAKKPKLHLNKINIKHTKIKKA